MSVINNMTNIIDIITFKIVLYLLEIVSILLRNSLIFIGENLEEKSFDILFKK